MRSCSRHWAIILAVLSTGWADQLVVLGRPAEVGDDQDRNGGHVRVDGRSVGAVGGVQFAESGLGRGSLA